ncbi:hypothetical protein ACG2LH_03780 [Zhouia sp. PK063]|uniref:hypothetical protein n=1 Tax=Zhouia sp. PK063 TaxID=3373602 RepID=UPI0037ACF00C
MKYASLIIAIIAIGLIVFNVTQINYSAPLEGKSAAAVIGVMAGLCAVVLIAILTVSKKIQKKLKEQA